MKQSEFFILVIKGTWVLSGDIDRKHPQHNSMNGQVCAVKADCHHGGQSPC